MSQPKPRKHQTAISTKDKRLSTLLLSGILTAGTLSALQALTSISLAADEDSSNNQNNAINKPITDKWALVVGISKFKDPNLNLRYPAKDARDFYNCQDNFSPQTIDSFSTTAINSY